VLISPCPRVIAATGTWLDNILNVFRVACKS